MDPEDGYVIFRTIKERVKKLMNARPDPIEISVVKKVSTAEIGVSKGLFVKESYNALVADKTRRPDTIRSMKLYIGGGFIENIAAGRKTSHNRLTEKGGDMVKHAPAKTRTVSEPVMCSAEEKGQRSVRILSKMHENFLLRLGGGGRSE